MMMLCGQSNPIWHWAAGAYPGKVGQLFGPSYWRKQVIRDWMPFALDNDAFSAWMQDTEWDLDAWRDMIDTMKKMCVTPLWALVPDVVTDAEATIRKWNDHHNELDRTGWSKAFAVQDGMTPKDVPENADVVFVGGSDSFKWRYLHLWVDNFPRVHVGRVNEISKVWLCDDMGVESVDGTGWFRDPSRKDKLHALRRWIEGKRNDETMELL